MFTLLSSNGNSTLTLAMTIIIAILVAAGAGIKVFKALKDKKVNTDSLEALINCIVADKNVSEVLRGIFTDELFQKCDTYDEFIQLVNECVQEKLYIYIIKNNIPIPENLMKFVTLENMGYVANAVLGLFGYDGKKLADMFEEHLLDLITDEDDDTDDDLDEDVDSSEEDYDTSVDDSADNEDSSVDESVENVEPAVEKIEEKKKENAKKIEFTIHTDKPDKNGRIISQLKLYNNILHDSFKTYYEEGSDNAEDAQIETKTSDTVEETAEVDEQPVKNVETEEASSEQPIENTEAVEFDEAVEESTKVDEQPVQNDEVVDTAEDTSTGELVDVVEDTAAEIENDTKETPQEEITE